MGQVKISDWKMEFYLQKMKETISLMIRFLEREINDVPPHTKAWYKLYTLHTHLNETLSSVISALEKLEV